MTTFAAAVASGIATAHASVPGIPGALAQAGVLGDPMGQLLIALVVIAVVIVVGKFLLSLAWRLITIAVVVVAVAFGLSAAGLI
ncbi:hypothetical protein [Halorubrum tibetense]|uniref:Major facilitator superfamily (MFS) profile domain-containing protein n=1 Tax=Halorubrum tibetense TaxID=175631 RepID=A0ABD5SAS8_9EURY